MASHATGMHSHGDIFLKLDGVEGESGDHAHKNEIEILSFSFGAMQPSSAGRGTGAGVGKVMVHDFNFTKFMDKASPKLFLACANGQHLPTVTLTCRKAGGAQQEYSKIIMKDCIITAFNHSGSGGHSLPTESVSIGFGSIEMEYKAQDEKGSLGGVVKAGWNLAKNTKI